MLVDDLLCIGDASGTLQTGPSEVCHYFLSTCSQQEPKQPSWTPPCFGADRGQCDSGQKIANGKVKTDLTEWIAKTEGNHIKAHEADRVTHRMYKVHHFLIGILGAIQSKVSVCENHMTWTSNALLSTKMECSANSAFSSLLYLMSLGRNVLSNNEYIVRECFW